MAQERLGAPQSQENKERLGAPQSQENKERLGAPQSQENKERLGEPQSTSRAVGGTTERGAGTNDKRLGEPQSEAQKRARRFSNLVPMRYILPNLVTLLALCSGMTAIRLSIEGRFELAVGAIILAIILDAMDGRLARLLKGTSPFGAELDSLADFVNFGVTPALILYFWSLSQLRALGWIIALLLALCCALRLARFNVAPGEENWPSWHKGFFIGAPAPAGAGLALVPLYLGFLGSIQNGYHYAGFVAPYIVLVAFLMVSRIPTYSGKNIGALIKRDFVLPILGGGVLLIVFLITYPWQVLSLIALAYLCSLPFSARRFRRFQVDSEK